MMEKYGVSQKDLPPTDDQIRLIKKLASEKEIPVMLPTNQEEANNAIKRLSEE